jgi:ketosteroid isomerase-like protein
MTHNEAVLEELSDTVARLDAFEQIRQLAARWALAADSRNVDDIIALYVEDVRVGSAGMGREALREWFDGILRGYEASIHYTANHVIDLQDTDHAYGVVYCRLEMEREGHWGVQAMQYWDNYERRGDRWYFLRRRPVMWYTADLPGDPKKPDSTRPHVSFGLRTRLPEAWGSWEAFWKGKS